jgi:hypothetical protein
MDIPLRGMISPAQLQVLRARLGMVSVRGADAGLRHPGCRLVASSTEPAWNAAVRSIPVLELWQLDRDAWWMYLTLCDLDRTAQYPSSEALAEDVDRLAEAVAAAAESIGLHCGPAIPSPEGCLDRVPAPGPVTARHLQRDDDASAVYRLESCVDGPSAAWGPLLSLSAHGLPAHGAGRYLHNIRLAERIEADIARFHDLADCFEFYNPPEVVQWLASSPAGETPPFGAGLPLREVARRLEIDEQRLKAAAAEVAYVELPSFSWGNGYGDYDAYATAFDEAVWALDDMYRGFVVNPHSLAFKLVYGLLRGDNHDAATAV